MCSAKTQNKPDKNESTVEANEALDAARTDRDRQRTGKIFAGQRAEYALNPIDDEEAGPEAESETKKELKEATGDRRNSRE